MNIEVAKVPADALKAISPNSGQKCCLTENVLRQYGRQGIEWWNEVQRRYGEIQRHYHTLTHIENMLGLLEIFKNNLTDPNAVALAIIFHDIVYDPWAKDNEESSAACFETFAMDVNLDSDLVKKVNEWIIVTKSHVTDAHKAGCQGSEDVHYFIDMDMQVLGWPEEDYAIYAEQIRQEYSHIPDKEYRKARAEVLKKLFSSPHLYATKEFREQYEAQARSNLVAEIKRLERIL